MLSGKDFYKILAAIVPLYVAMILAYASVRFWNIFTPQQCAGINRYVATFAIPILSFHVIASCNFYEMNFRFLGADTLQKVVILVALGLWSIFNRSMSVEWVISFFSLSTLPNTLIIGIPLLQAMYGDVSKNLMVQIVVFQVLIWYILLLILYEYRAAVILFNAQFPDCSRAITTVKVDSDVFSLNGRESLETEAEIDDNANVHVVIRRSSASSMGSVGINPRASNLSGVEIYSLQSLSRTSSFNKPDSHYGSQKNEFGGRTEAVFSMHDLKPANAQADWIVDTKTTRIGKRSYGGKSQSSESIISGFLFPLGEPSHPISMTSINELPLSVNGSNSSSVPAKGLHMHDWVSSAAGNQNFRGRLNEYPKNVSEMSEEKGNAVNTEGGMPPVTVMTKLVILMVWRKLIRNPAIHASVLGLAWSLLSFKLHIQLPLIVGGSIQILSDTGLGMAMFSLGLFTGLQPKLIPCGYSLATLAMALKFIVGPLVAAATSVALGLRGQLLRISIVQAALPAAIVPFVYANEYEVQADLISVAVVFGILLSLPMGLLYYVILAAI